MSNRISLPTVPPTSLLSSPDSGFIHPLFTMVPCPLVEFPAKGIYHHVRPETIHLNPPIYCANYLWVLHRVHGSSTAGGHSLLAMFLCEGVFR